MAKGTPALIPSRIPELDGLRGTAILLVLLFHIALTVPMQHNPLRHFMLFGWSGVDLFFVLSGFLIGGILIDNRESGSYFRTFYARRVFRILPIYLVVLAMYAAVFALGGHARSSLMSRLGPPMPWYTYLSFTNNLWIAAHDNMNVFISPTWSLAIEEQFYLTLPLLVWLIRPRHLVRLVAGTVIAVLTLRAVFAGLGAVTQNQAYVLPFFRFDALMIGVGCALIVRSRRVFMYLKTHAKVVYAAVAVLGTGVIVLGTELGPVGVPPSNTLMMFGLTVIALFYASLLLLSLLRPTHAWAWVMRLRPLRALGKVSYCVYLVHQPLLALGFKFFHHTWTGALVGIGVTLLFAEISWYVLEGPMMRIGHRFKYAPPRVEETAEAAAPEVQAA